MLKKLIKSFLDPIRAINDLLLNNELKRFIVNPKNPLNKFGKRCYSQCDEDGITLEIVRRLNIKRGVFFEFGCDNGTQNNTLILAALKWKGVWIDAIKLIFDHTRSNRLAYFNTFVTTSNVLEIIEKGLGEIGEKNIDCLSIDLDGSDYHIVEKILDNKINPSFFIVEIDQAIPPPVEIIPPKKNNPKQEMVMASLSAYNNLFIKHGYTLICCSSVMGHNAFFIQNKFLDKFPEVPKKVEDIYITPNLTPFSPGYSRKINKSILEKIFEN